MTLSAVEEGASKRKDHVGGLVIPSFEHAAYAILGEETDQRFGVVGRGEVDVKTVGGRLLLNGGEEVVEVIENGDADGRKRTMEMGGPGSGEGGFRTERIDGCELHEFGDTEVKILEGFVDKDAVRGEMWSDVVEGIGLGE